MMGRVSGIGVGNCARNGEERFGVPFVPDLSRIGASPD